MPLLNAALLLLAVSFPATSFAWIERIETVLEPASDVVHFTSQELTGAPASVDLSNLTFLADVQAVGQKDSSVCGIFRDTSEFFSSFFAFLGGCNLRLGGKYANWFRFDAFWSTFVVDSLCYIVGYCRLSVARKLYILSRTGMSFAGRNWHTKGQSNITSILLYLGIDYLGNMP